MKLCVSEKCIFVWTEDQRHNLGVIALWFSPLKISRLWAIWNTGLTIPSLACFHFYWQFNTLVYIQNIRSETSWVRSFTKTLELLRKLLFDNIGCKVIGDVCEPGRNDLCNEVCTTEDQEDTAQESRLP